MLKTSARNCISVVSLSLVFLTKEKSRFHQLEPVNVLRPKFPGLVSTCWPFTELNTVGAEKRPEVANDRVGQKLGTAPDVWSQRGLQKQEWPGAKAVKYVVSVLQTAVGAYNRKRQTRLGAIDAQDLPPARQATWKFCERRPVARGMSYSKLPTNR